MDVIYDMETRDADDLFALGFLISHPQVRLRAVTINPGTREQVGMVRQVLDRTGKEEVPIGALRPGTVAKAVSKFYKAFFGDVDAEPDGPGSEIIKKTLERCPDAVMITGAPLNNQAHAFRNYPDLSLKRWVAQGGFAGDNVVAPEHRLEKFEGMTRCRTYNFGSDPEAASYLLREPRIGQCDMVSKNVCHGLVYDRLMHERMRPHRHETPGLSLIYEGMDQYLERMPRGKKFHDPLAAVVAVRREVCKFREVKPDYREGKWGSIPRGGTNRYISVSVDSELFFRTLVEH